MLIIVLLTLLVSVKLYINKAKKRINKSFNTRFNNSDTVYYYTNNSLIKFTRR